MYRSLYEISVRWKRGDPTAYVLGSIRVWEHFVVDVIGTILMLPIAWTDLIQIRDLAAVKRLLVSLTVPGCGRCRGCAS